MRYTMCRWCHRFNPTSVALCRECGHAAHVTRPECACHRCRPLRGGPLKALPAPDPRLRGRLAFARWLVASGRLSEQL